MKEAILSIENSIDEAYERVRKLFRFKYPKLLILFSIIILAYLIFTQPYFENFVSRLDNLGYLSIIFSGVLFSFGFTTPFAVGIFLSLNPENILLASLLGGIGAMISDIFIFKIIKFSFIDEFKLLEKTKPLKKIISLIDNNIAHKIKIYLLYAFAGIIIASPLPDEIGVTMLAGLTKIKIRKLALISFIFNTIGILLLFLF
ncbi:hypothetical protein HYW75_06795 [Candidatus Pacearchaeota archaeon]|nr:hypothetical protein [Candidatus Pacearchaeota archaeon]